MLSPRAWVGQSRHARPPSPAPQPASCRSRGSISDRPATRNRGGPRNRHSVRIRRPGAFQAGLPHSNRCTRNGRPSREAFGPARGGHSAACEPMRVSPSFKTGRGGARRPSRPDHHRSAAGDAKPRPGDPAGPYSTASPGRSGASRPPAAAPTRPPAFAAATASCDPNGEPLGAYAACRAGIRSGSISDPCACGAWRSPVTTGARTCAPAVIGCGGSAMVCSRAPCVARGVLEHRDVGGRVTPAPPRPP